MSVSYRIYGNTGIGDAVDYTTVIDTVSTLTWSSSILAASSDWTFAVRAFDTVSTLEESNVDARTRVIVDSTDTLDLSGRPLAPTGLTATIVANGALLGAKLTWHFLLPSGGNQPTSFLIYQTVGPTVNFSASPVATITYIPGKTAYWTTLSGLTTATQYSFAVRASNASGADQNTTTITLTASSTPPNAVGSLAGTLS
jgi:hypothetical protein